MSVNNDDIEPEVPEDLRVRCYDCGGMQIWKREGAEIVVYHSCFNGKKVPERIAALEAQSIGIHFKAWATSAMAWEIAEQKPSIVDAQNSRITELEAQLKDAKAELLHAPCPTCPKCGWYTCDHSEGALAAHDAEVRWEALNDLYLEIGKVAVRSILAMIDKEKQ